MRRKTRIPVLILTAIAGALTFTQALAGGLVLQPESRLWLDGKSTLHDFSSTASSLQATFEQNETLWPADATGSAAIESFIRARGVSAMEVVIGVTGLHSGKAGLDKNMYKALQAPKYPEIRFRMSGYETAEGPAPAEMAIDAKGTLSVAGVEKEIALPVTALKEGENVRVRGSVPLLMSQYGIKPPTMMMGAIKTADQVVIHFDLLFGAKPPTDGISKVE